MQVLNEAHYIFGCIFSMLFSDFRARRLRSIPTSPMMTLMKFLNADTETNIYS